MLSDQNGEGRPSEEAAPKNIATAISDRHIVAKGAHGERCERLEPAARLREKLALEATIVEIGGAS